MLKALSITAALTAALALTAPASAKVYDITVRVENLSPANSISFAPLRFGFNAGVFDSFNNGEAASEAIISVAEGGSGSAWLPAFAAADPTAVLGSTMGALLPGCLIHDRRVSRRFGHQPVFHLRVDGGTQQ